MNTFKKLSMSVVASTLALSCLAHAQTTDSTGTTTPMDSTTMQSGTTMQGGMMQGNMMTPTAVSGTVLRYYVDRSGFVSAMDVQTADGVRMVRFAPQMAQNLTTMYPVGATANVYVTSSMSGGMTNYYLAGMGSEMPMPSSMMMPMTVTDLDVLKSEPFVMLGSKSMRVSGMLDGYVSDERGEVLAIVLKNDMGSTLVRVPRENRLVGSSMASSSVVPLIKGASVVAYGMMEAPRFGVVSPYTNRVVASGISVGGQTLGPLGFGRVMSGGKGTLLGFNVNLGGAVGGTSPEEVQAGQMGYSTYSMPGSTGMMPATGTGTTDGAMGNTMPEATTGGTMPGGTMTPTQ